MVAAPDQLQLEKLRKLQTVLATDLGHDAKSGFSGHK